MARKNRIVDLPPDVRLDIERQLARGVSKVSLIHQFGHYGVNKDNLLIYERNHLSGRLAAAWRRRAENNVVQVLDEMSTLMDQSREILEDALDKGHNSLALKAIAQIRNNLELVARIQHAIAQQQAEQQVIEVKSEEQNTWKEGYKKLSKQEQEEYTRLVYRMVELTGESHLVEDQDQDSNYEYRINPDDHSLTPKQVPRRKDIGGPTRRLNPGKPDTDAMTNTR